jgi:hypothetical protein
MFQLFSNSILFLKVQLKINNKYQKVNQKTNLLHRLQNFASNLFWRLKCNVIIAERTVANHKSGDITSEFSKIEEFPLKDSGCDSSFFNFINSFLDCNLLR